MGEIFIFKMSGLGGGRNFFQNVQDYMGEIVTFKMYRSRRE